MKICIQLLANNKVFIYKYKNPFYNELNKTEPICMNNL